MSTRHRFTERLRDLARDGITWRTVMIMAGKISSKAYRFSRRQYLKLTGDKIVINIDNTWSNDYSMGVSGWIASKEDLRDRVELCIGDKYVPVTTWLARPDVKALYPQCFNEMCGFIVHHERLADHKVNFRIRSGKKMITRSINHRGARPASAGCGSNNRSLFAEFQREVNERGLKVLEIGSRNVSPGGVSKRSLFPQASAYVGFDYYSDDNTDIVGDAHRLSLYFERESFDAVFSLAVFEHFAMPWVVVMEINKILKKGGLTYHLAPQSWPVHDNPWDFWRFSDNAFRVLFSRPMGFDVMETQMTNPVQMFFEQLVPGQEAFPFCSGYGFSEIIARKSGDFDDHRTCWNISLDEILGSDNVYPKHQRADHIIKFPESKQAHKYLDGLSGLEIGGSAHNPFGLNTKNIDNTGDMDTVFKKEEIKLCGQALAVDIVAQGDEIPVADESQDFVINSHVLEHFWDPIKALKEWHRVIKPGGYIFMIVPHKERTFDSGRPRTTLEELIERQENGCSALVSPEGHHSVWITEDVVELLKYLQWSIIEVNDVDDKVGNGFTIVVKK